MDSAAVVPDSTTPIPADGAAVPVDGAAPLTNEEEKKDGDDGEEDEKPKPMYERYEYLDPRKFTPICTLKI